MKSNAPNPDGTDLRQKRWQPQTEAESESEGSDAPDPGKADPREEQRSHVSFIL